MYLELCGAAEGVTGSLHRVHVGDADVLLDCGLFQGHRAEANRINRELPDWASEASALVLSHAHLDHSGAIPTLVKRGFGSSIYCTPATRDLCSVMLRDSAMIQEQDARYLNKRFERDRAPTRIAPLYDVHDAQRAVSQMISLPLHRPMRVAAGVTVTLHNAAHVLGSALVQLDLEENGKRARLLFTGDLGRDELPLLDDREIVAGVDYLLMESTYGDRLHPPLASSDEQLGQIVTDTIGRGGRVLIPTFALERAQEVLFALERLHGQGRMPRVPIYIDSPLAIAITEIYKLHPESLSPDVAARMLNHENPFSPPGLRYVSDVASSKALQRSGEPCVVMAGSGMCEGGRILHHLQGGLSDDRNSVVIVGFQAQHTLGRRLVEHRPRVKVFGIERDVAARVHVLNGLSAHADQAGLLGFARATAQRGALRGVALVHGEDAPKRTLAALLEHEGLPNVVAGHKGLRIDLS
ncbi:MAG: MBL fold metallo-hydrolase RNA specificity domain-containing protein [Polyangiales bacterium]